MRRKRGPRQPVLRGTSDRPPRTPPLPSTCHPHRSRDSVTRHPCRWCPRTFAKDTSLTHHEAVHRIGIRIEQALAFGHTDMWIRADLLVTDDEIDAARARIYTANKETG